MPLSLLNHSALALFARRTRIPTSARSIGFCAIWVCISSSSSSSIKGIINVNVASAAPASSTAAAAATAATTAAASPAAGASSLYTINTHGPPVDEGKESAPNDTTITKYLNRVKECISPSYSHSDLKSDGILVSGKCDYASSSSSNSFLVEGSKQ